jgi:cytochrome c biogenesis protein CcdA
MYLVAIAWLYVTLLMAAAERNVVSGVMTFMIYGLGPLALFLWLFGTPQRARVRALRALQQARRDDQAAGEDAPPPP